ncbi:CPBP family intramembrane glutamic endopeptidase [Dendrosporobacter sp. 1207_IL3150]|uniref:CPBP family intramembrane glutamic endopeptidase n=1 Tax=Dendrosporobacter sp. 1207_IL3150 TaxID=3084054 RepID=UPI002FDB8CF6
MECWKKLIVYLSCKIYLLLYFWIFIVVWATVNYSVPGLFTAGTILPVYMYIRYVDNRKVVEFLKLDKSRLISGYLWGSVLSAILITIIAAKIHFQGEGTFYYQWELKDILSIVVIASIVEEVFFRGFLMQKLMESTSFNIANILVTIFFVLIHFPSWIADNLAISDIANGLIYLTGFSWLLGYIFKCSQSLWTPIIMHATNNLINLSTITIQYTSYFSP